MTTQIAGNGDNDTITGVRLDIARLEGMLTAFLTDGVRRIEDTEKANRELRADLTAVKDNSIANVNAVAHVTNANTVTIADIREDIKSIIEKQNATLGKVTMVVSPVIAVVALLWNVLGK